MSMPDMDGRFRAEVIDAGVAPTGVYSLTTVTLRLRLVERLEDGEWIDCRGYGWEINSYNYLEKKEPLGALNLRTIESLKATFGWPGDDPFWFEDQVADLPGCQVTLKWEEWQGKSRLKVTWIDPWESEPASGGIVRSDEAIRAAIRARLGAKLRANAAPAAASSGGSIPARPAPSAKTEEDLWEWWCVKSEEQGLPEAQRNELWTTTLKAVCNDPFGTNLSAQDLLRLEEELQRLVTP